MPATLNPLLFCLALFLLEPVRAPVALAATPADLADAESLSAHLHGSGDLGELRDLTVAWDEEAGGTLWLTAEKTTGYAWAVVPPPRQGWKLARRARVEAEISNRGPKSVKVLFWVVGDRGWDAVPAMARLAPGETRTLACPLRATFPDGTPKLDPGQIRQLQIMVRGRHTLPVTLEVRGLVAAGAAPDWVRPSGRIDLPPLRDAPPSAGQRVRYRLAEDEGTGLYSVLHLPADWRPGAAWPLIVEFPGNIFFDVACYSTGRPDQCVIGHGIARGRGAICLSLPFVDRARRAIAEDGWGDPEATAAYAVRMVGKVGDKFGADLRNVLLTGFSRGAIACGFIGLRDDRIATLWKGFHMCQHYDGDGWNRATMEGALERALRFRGRAVFHTDNDERAVQPVIAAMQTQATYARSGLGAHATAMFLDDRPSTRQLRQWFADLVR